MKGKVLYMAERIDGVLSELLAAQENEPAPAPDEIPNTEPAAEGGNDAVTEGTPEAANTEGDGAENPEAPPITEEQATEDSGEVPQSPAPDPQIEALAKTTEALNGIRGENQQLHQVNQQMQQMLKQMQEMMMHQQKAQSEANKANEEAVAKAITEPPTLNLKEIQYLDDEAQGKALAEYNNAVAEYAKQGVMKELQPIVDQYHRQTKEAADAAVRNQLIGSGRFEGFSEDAEQIEKIIRSTPGLSDLPPETKYAIGYVINRGVKAMNTKPAAPEKTEDLVARVLKNPEAMKAIEKERVLKIAQANKAAPPVAASQGQNNAPAVAPNPPQNLDEARARARKIFGI